MSIYRLIFSLIFSVIMSKTNQLKKNNYACDINNVENIAKQICDKIEPDTSYELSTESEGTIDMTIMTHKNPKYDAQSKSSYADTKTDNTISKSDKKFINYPNICNNFHFSNEDNITLNNSYIKIIEINKIKMIRKNDEYDDHRYDHSYKLINDSKTVLPIEVLYNKKHNEYRIIDGHHRCKVCVNLGYISIPAIIFEDIDSDDESWMIKNYKLSF
jgi:hypothetical protein